MRLSFPYSAANFLWLCLCSWSCRGDRKRKTMDSTHVLGDQRSSGQTANAPSLRVSVACLATAPVDALCWQYCLEAGLTETGIKAKDGGKKKEGDLSPFLCLGPGWEGVSWGSLSALRVYFEFWRAVSCNAEQQWRADTLSLFLILAGKLSALHH